MTESTCVKSFREPLTVAIAIVTSTASTIFITTSPESEMNLTSYFLTLRHSVPSSSISMNLSL
jgi:hypothetical protein